jgi:membrane-associated phospholipid phosphatase
VSPGTIPDSPGPRPAGGAGGADQTGGAAPNVRVGRSAAVAPLTAAALLVVFVVIALASGPDSGLSAWDRRVSDAFIAWRTPGRTHFLYAVTLLGNWTSLMAFAVSAVLLLAVWGRRWWALLVGGGLLIAWGISELAKVLIGRARPPAADALIASPSSGSLPSGHALTTMVFLGLLVLVAFRWRRARSRAGRGAAFAWVALVVAVVVAALIGVSRVYLGVHWLSDVFGGWTLAGAWLATVVAVVLGGVWTSWRARRRHTTSPSGEPPAASLPAGSVVEPSVAGRRAPARPAVRAAAVAAAVVLCAAGLLVSAWLDPLLADL